MPIDLATFRNVANSAIVTSRDIKLHVDGSQNTTARLGNYIFSAGKKANTAVMDAFTDEEAEDGEKVVTEDNVEETLTRGGYTQETGATAKSLVAVLADEILKERGQERDDETASKTRVRFVETVNIKVQPNAVALKAEKPYQMVVKPMKVYNPTQMLFAMIKAIAWGEEQEFVLKTVVDEDGNLVTEIPDDVLAVLSDAAATQVNFFEVTVEE